jgi:hypothetical protein
MLSDQLTNAIGGNYTDSEQCSHLCTFFAFLTIRYCQPLKSTNEEQCSSGRYSKTNREQYPFNYFALQSGITFIGS